MAPVECWDGLLHKIGLYVYIGPGEDRYVAGSEGWAILWATLRVHRRLCGGLDI
jgi:hypothetical protein